MALQLSTDYSVNQSSSLFTINIPEICVSQEVVTVQLHNAAQESFVRQSLAEPFFLVRRVKYDKVTGKTEELSDWQKFRSDGFKFVGMDGKEIHSYNTMDVLSRFKVE